MPNYRDINLLAVRATLVPSGSIINLRDEAFSEGSIQVYGDPEQVIIMDEYPETDLAEPWTPASDWNFRYWDDEGIWYKTIQDCVTIDFEASGDGFGEHRSGIDYEIGNMSRADVFRIDQQPNDIQEMAKIARDIIAKYLATGEYRWSSESRTPQDQLRPFYIRNGNTVHFILVYAYNVYVDDYNHESDTDIQLLGRLDLGNIKVLGEPSAITPENFVG